MLAVILAAAILGCGGEGEEPGGEPLTVWDESAERDPAAETGLAEEKAAESMPPSQDAGTHEVEPSTLPQMRQLMIKSASMELEASKGEYARIREEAVAIAASLAGFVESESSRRDDGGYTYASLTLRVPSEKFDEAMSRASELGEVVSSQVSTQDVSGEYVDLESRLKHLEAEEAFYLTLIGEAETIQDMISIKEHLSAIQLEKEQVQGRKNFLDEQISYSTITLTVEEVSPGEEQEGFWNSIKDAFKSFGRGLRKLAVGFFYALPYLIILALIILVVWLVIRRTRHGDSEGDAEQA